MDIRTVYASAITIFAALIGFYAVMTLAFFFGESRPEWVFPVIITLLTALLVWTAVKLWRKKDALACTGLSLAATTILLGWIIIPPGTWDAGFVMIVIAWIINIGLLAGLLVENTRISLSKDKQR